MLNVGVIVMMPLIMIVMLGVGVFVMVPLVMIVKVVVIYDVSTPAQPWLQEFVRDRVCVQHLCIC